jgi:membrane protein
MSNSVWWATKTVVVKTVVHFDDVDGWAMASHLALSVLMAMFPFLIFVAAVAGMMDTRDLVSGVVTLMFQSWPHEVADPLSQEVQTVLNNSRSDVLTYSVVLTFVLASNGVEALRTALNRAYGIIDSRSFMRRRLQSLVFVLVGALGMLAVAFLVVLWPLVWNRAAPYIPGVLHYQATLDLLRYGTAGVVLMVALFAAHLWLAGGRRGLAEVWPGVLMTLILWLVGASGFAVYLEGFADYVSTYAGLAGVMTALFFMYLLSVVFILGGELNAAIQHLKRPNDQNHRYRNSNDKDFQR